MECTRHIYQCPFITVGFHIRATKPVKGCEEEEELRRIVSQMEEDGLWHRQGRLLNYKNDNWDGKNKSQNKIEIVRQSPGDDRVLTEFKCAKKRLKSPIKTRKSIPSISFFFCFFFQCLFYSYPTMKGGRNKSRFGYWPPWIFSTSCNYSHHDANTANLQVVFISICRL